MEAITDNEKRCESSRNGVVGYNTIIPEASAILECCYSIHYRSIWTMCINQSCW